MKIISILKDLFTASKDDAKKKDGVSWKLLITITVILLTISSTVYLLVGNRVPTANAELVSKIDSLQATVNKLEQDAQSLLDRGMELNNTLDDLQTEVDSLHGMRFIVRKYIHTKIEATKSYEAKQVDSFLKDRYNY